MESLSHPSNQMPRWKIWFLATRPWSLSISIIPILLATALAWTYGTVSIPLGNLALLTTVFTHIGCNLTNDYFDDATGVDAVQPDGHGGMLQHGQLTNGDIRKGMIVAFAAAFLTGLPIIVHLGWIGVLLALVGAGVAFLYTGGPWPLAYNRMGEIGVFTAMGLVMVGGAFYVHTGTITWPAIILATNVGLYAAAILHSNNMRDIESDAKHAKHTLANTFGWAWGVREYVTLVAAPLVLTGVLVLLQPEYSLVLATLLITPLLLEAVRHMRAAREGTLTSAIVGQSVNLHMGYSAIATLAVLVTGLLLR